ncbi:NAD(P)-dependent oxidoreductase [Rossellomorea marisflavi]|uniref:NAD(P)-dependent oxidoreductase n=1 Tax=Rossellomorea marisflavi TaxID=189381 RepID=UPI00069DDB47|nr:NAD(P)-dependent oxidoreductase [Rossellomorea marisflavi]
MKLLLTGAFKYSADQLSILESFGYEIIFIKDERITLEIDSSDIEAVVCNGLFQYNDIRKFNSLRFIQLTSAGIDRVPLDYIRSKEIKLLNANGVYSTPMAEWVVLKILEIYKKSKSFYEAQSKHIWEKNRNILELTNKRVTILGFGNVGLAIAKRLKAFDMHVSGIGRHAIKTEFLDEYYLNNDVDTVLKKSDIIIVTLPYTSETASFLNDKRLSLLKEESVIINVSRGGIIDESALKKHLKRGKFLGVALDVFEKEPLEVENKLWDSDRVIITPHNSFLSDKTNERLFNIIQENLYSYITENKKKQ